MDVLANNNLYQVTKIKGDQIFLKSLLGDKAREKELNSNDYQSEVVRGDLFFLAAAANQAQAEHYAVQKIKGRYSDFKEFIYLKMRIMLDFYKYNFDQAIFHAKEKPAAYQEFEKILTENKEKIKSFISYNSDEKVKPFNHTNYEISEILESELIFEQEEGSAFDWQWNLMRIYKLAEDQYVSFKQSSIFSERQRGEYFKIEKKYVDIMRNLEEDKAYFLD